MEAETLKRKKTTISKGKIKKTIKNVICRPDPTAWPLADKEEAEEIKSLLNKYRVDIPTFKKLPWKELKLIPKNERPKQPPIEKVSGLIFGMTECRTSLQNKNCSAILIEATVNPKTIVQSIIADCLLLNIPVLCLHELKYLCAKNFGIPTCCLAIQECLKDLTDKIQDISSSKKQRVIFNEAETKVNVDRSEDDTKMEVEIDKKIPIFSYLYRTNKKSRMFIPNNIQANKIEEFAGQHFIEFSNKDQPDSKEGQNDSKKYMKMILKRVSNNPNRVKVKNK